MTGITIALLSGFLSRAQATELSVHCLGVVENNALVVQCALLHKDTDGKMTVLKGATLPPLPSERISLETLSTAYLVGIDAVTKFPQSQPT